MDVSALVVAEDRENAVRRFAIRTSSLVWVAEENSLYAIVLDLRSVPIGLTYKKSGDFSGLEMISLINVPTRGEESRKAVRCPCSTEGAKGLCLICRRPPSACMSAADVPRVCLW